MNPALVIILLAIILQILTLNQFVSAQETDVVIPDWLKKTASWWAEGLVSDIEFVNAVEFMINERIIQSPVFSIDETEKSSDITQQEVKVPDWIKNNAQWWSEDKISDLDFVIGIEHMVKEKIISSPKIKIKEKTDRDGIPFSDPSNELNPEQAFNEYKLQKNDICQGYSKFTPLNFLDDKADLCIKINGYPMIATNHDTIEYSLSVKNLGPGYAKNVVVVNEFPSIFQFTETKTSNCNHELPSHLTDGGRLVCRLGDMTSGKIISITFSGTVPNIKEDTRLVNKASVLFTEEVTKDPNPKNNVDIVAYPLVRVEEKKDISPKGLDLNISYDKNIVAIGETFTYNMRIKNFGNEVANDVKIELIASEKYLSFADSEKCSISPFYHFRSLSIFCEINSIPQGKEFEIPVQLKVKDNTPKGKTLGAAGYYATQAEMTQYFKSGRPLPDVSDIGHSSFITGPYVEYEPSNAIRVVDQSGVVVGNCDAEFVVCEGFPDIKRAQVTVKWNLQFGSGLPATNVKVSGTVSAKGEEQHSQAINVSSDNLGKAEFIMDAFPGNVYIFRLKDIGIYDELNNLQWGYFDNEGYTPLEVVVPLTELAANRAWVSKNNVNYDTLSGDFAHASWLLTTFQRMGQEYYLHGDVDYGNIVFNETEKLSLPENTKVFFNVTKNQDGAISTYETFANTLPDGNVVIEIKEEPPPSTHYKYSIFRIENYSYFGDGDALMIPPLDKVKVVEQTGIYSTELYGGAIILKYVLEFENGDPVINAWINGCEDKIGGQNCQDFFEYFTNLDGVSKIIFEKEPTGDEYVYRIVKISYKAPINPTWDLENPRPTRTILYEGDGILIKTPSLKVTDKNITFEKYAQPGTGIIKGFFKVEYENGDPYANNFIILTIDDGSKSKILSGKGTDSQGIYHFELQNPKPDSTYTFWLGEKELDERDDPWGTASFIDLSQYPLTVKIPKELSKSIKIQEKSSIPSRSIDSTYTHLKWRLVHDNGEPLEEGVTVSVEIRYKTGDGYLGANEIGRVGKNGIVTVPISFYAQHSSGGFDYEARINSVVGFKLVKESQEDWLKYMEPYKIKVSKKYIEPSTGKFVWEFTYDNGDPLDVQVRICSTLSLIYPKDDYISTTSDCGLNFPGGKYVQIHPTGGKDVVIKFEITKTVEYTHKYIGDGDELTWSP